ncbi:MAG: hypothetical protein EZS28_028162 [Streblomastix strix]|uniref:Uncharacterized protein n=1 Tax=Streblomastix strix TaxID=222440 RepID=A0A5J4V1R7_9EUKA|nr:MAG: hypothetical protein EZS28_028162 [Streblomastix strix]
MEMQKLIRGLQLKGLACSTNVSVTTIGGAIEYTTFEQGQLIIGGGCIFDRCEGIEAGAGAIFSNIQNGGQLIIEGNCYFDKCINWIIYYGGGAVSSVLQYGGRSVIIRGASVFNSCESTQLGGALSFQIQNEATVTIDDSFQRAEDEVERILTNINSPSFNKTSAIYGTEFGAKSELGRKPFIDQDLEEDPRAGTACIQYCKSKSELTSDCICDSNSSSYPSSDCEKDKLCTFNLTNQSNATCPCQSTGDPKNGSFCLVYCMKGQVSINCVCDTNSTIFPLAQCQKDMLCATDLVHQSASDCPCLSTGDPRAGNTCPSYCTAKRTPNANFACDSNPNAQYFPSQCQSDRKCTASSSSTVPTDLCIYSEINYPYGCYCPMDSSQLSGIPSSRCESRTIGDPRANRTCSDQ